MGESSEIPVNQANQSETKSSDKNIPRRTFLKFLGGLAASAALGSSQSPSSSPEFSTPLPQNATPLEDAIVPEIEPQANLDALVVDITTETFSALDKYNIPSMSEQELAQKLGIEGELTVENLLAQKVPHDENLVMAILGQVIKFHYGNHGINVLQAMEQVDNLLKIKGSDPKLVSLAPNSIKHLEIATDEIGNPTVWLEFDDEVFEKIIAASPQTFVNLSLELGRLGMEFQIYKQQANPDAIDPLSVKRVKQAVTINGVTSPSEYELDGRKLSQAEYDKILEDYNNKEIVPRDSSSYTPVDGYGRGGNPTETSQKWQI